MYLCIYLPRVLNLKYKFTDARGDLNQFEKIRVDLLGVRYNFLLFIRGIYYLSELVC